MTKNETTFEPAKPEGQPTIPITVPVRLPEPHHRAATIPHSAPHYSELPGVNFVETTGLWHASRTRGGIHLLNSDHAARFKAEQAVLQVDAPFAALFAKSLHALTEAAKRGQGGRDANPHSRMVANRSI